MSDEADEFVAQEPEEQELEQRLADALPPEIAQNVEVVKALRTVVASFSGPLPPPAMFRGYEEVLPGAANRILKLTEDEAQH